MPHRLLNLPFPEPPGSSADSQPPDHPTRCPCVYMPENALVTPNPPPKGREALDVELVRAFLKRSPGTARQIARRCQIPYRRVLAALRALEGSGAARWTASWYGPNDGYARVWGLSGEPAGDL